MDERFLENAQRQAEQELDRAIKERRQSQQTRPENFDGSCEGCGEDVPPARLHLGYFNCVKCQERVEKKLNSR